MKKLFSWLFNRWTISVLGLVLIALLIWFIGPEIGISGSAPLAGVMSRLIAIAVVVVLWAVFNGIALYRQRKANQAVVEGLVAQQEALPEDPSAMASREEREKLAERFREALAMLKEAKLGGTGGRRLLYQLPWYVIIGPPGCGKTTALANSGLKFPLVDKFGKHSVRGVGGTRNCDWFFTDDAVLIDTAGRYTTQDSDAAVDRSAWQSFLDLLRKHRPQRPIDGILVAFSITDIVGRDSAERLSHAHAVKRRIEEIYEGLKVRAPIYVVFTKCDLIAGFTDFFGGMTAEEREQVWGTTFPLKLSQDPNALLQAFPAEFDLLLERLTARIIPRLEEERELGRRGLLMSFPEQMNLLKAQLQEFLGEALGQTRFEQPVFVRGVYFTSATQQGSPIDRIIGSIASTFHLERQAMPAFSGRGVSYFLTGLLQNVVFPEAGLVTTTGFFNRYRAYLQWGAYGGAAVLTALLVLVLLGSYTGNTGLIADTDKEVATVKETRGAALAGQGSIGDIFATLDALRNLPGGYAHRDEGAPLMLTFGLYQGDKLGEAAEDAYRRGLEYLFVPVLTNRIEQQITENLQNPEFLYQALKTYLMFSMPDRREPEFIKLWVTTDWNNRFPGAGNAPFRENFQGHLDALFDSGVDLAPQTNTALVARAQEALLRLPLGSRIYAQLKQQQQAVKGKEWTLADHVTSDLLRYFRRRSGAAMTSGVPQLFTVEGYRTAFIEKRSQLVEDVLKETWVLGPRYAQLQSDSERADLERRVEELYLSDYIKEWENLLNDLDLIPPGNVEGQAALVRAVSQADSPVKTVLQALVSQMQLSKSLLAAESKTKDLKDKAAAQLGEFQKWRERIEGLVTGGKPGTAEAAAVDPTIRVDRAFEPIIALVRSEAGIPPRIDGLLQPFGELYDFLLQVQQGGTDPKGALDRLSQDYPRGKAIVTRLENSAKVQPEPVRRWLLGLLTTRFAIDPKRGEAVQRLNEVLKGSVTPACKQALDGRYPMVRASTSDVNINDFARVFGPGGIIDAFAKKYIEPYADTSVRPWRWTEAASGGLGLSSGALRTFENAAKIRQAFFPSGAPAPQIFFTIEPLNLDSRARQVQLEIGDQSILYIHGPRRGARVQWPPAGGAGARIAFTPVDNPGQTIASTKPGPWGFFHLLDQAKVDGSPNMDSFRATFDIQGYQATFQIRAESVINPFSLPELQQFQCPENL